MHLSRASIPKRGRERFRELLMSVVSEKKKEKLHAAQRQYEAETAKLRAKRYRLPESADDKRRLLTAVLATQAQIRRR